MVVNRLEPHSNFGGRKFFNPMSQRNILIGLLVLIIFGGVIFFVSKKSQTTPTNNSQAETQLPTNSTTPTPSKVIKFSGEVANDQKFEKEIGNNLFFRLEPGGSSWTISIGSKTSKTSVKDVGYENYNNFAAVVTPPYRGINNIYIEGWHFRNSDNSGPNELGPKNVNAPGEVREFDFVLNDTDYQKASEALNKMLWSYSYSEQEVNEATIIHENLSKRHGKLTITDLKLNNLLVEKQAGIESMKFDVELNFP